MVQENNQKEKVEIYEIDNKKYTVITKCVENVQNLNNLYDFMCKYIISQIKKD